MRPSSLLVSITAVLYTGCFSGGPTTIPMHQVRSERTPGQQARCLVAFLPGLGDSPEKYQEEGFVEALRASGVDADVALVDSHIGYVREETILTRLREDVVLPAAAAGYEKIWVVGISLGGGLSLVLGTSESTNVEGLVLLAPYLGERSLVKEVAAAGGAASWSPGYSERQPQRRSNGSLTFRGIWDWARSRTRPDGAEMPVYLGYGDSDRGRRAHAMLAELLPEERVWVRPGGHGWSTWRVLWADFLASGALQRSCGPDMHPRPVL